MKKYGYFIILVIAMMFIPLVNAQSNYYEYIWTDDVGVYSSYVDGSVQYNNENSSHIANDIIKTDDGYLTVGFGHERGDNSIIRKLDEEGNFVENVEMPDYVKGKLKKVVEVNDSYYVIGVNGISGLLVIKLNSNLEYEGYITIDTTYSYDDYVDLYFVEIDDNVYAFNPYNASKYVICFADEFTSNEELTYDSLTDEVKDVVDNYVRVSTIYDELSTTNTNIDAVFSEKVNDGYLYGFYDWNNNISYLYYYEANTLEWQKTYSSIFYRDAIAFRDYILLISEEITTITGSVDSTTSTPYLVLMDLSGNIIEQDSLANYVTDPYQSFYPEHITVLNEGFAVTGLAENYECEDSEASDAVTCEMNEILYFNTLYKITTQTDGNGTLASSFDVASSGESVTFTVTPNEGYVLDAVKVTDKDGNTITFAFNTFTMPSADVIVEAYFKVENPNTQNILSFTALILAVVCGLVFLILKKKINWVYK